MNIEIPNGFEPRDYQVPIMAYLDNGGRRAVWIVHRRAGKDLTMLHQVCKMMHQRRGVYWTVFPTLEQGRKALWEGFTADGLRTLEQVFPAAIRKTPRSFAPNGDTIVELKCGSIWRLMGSDRMEVVGAGPVGVVFSEFALMNPKTWELVRPMLRENNGWAAFITTPRGNNHAKKLFDMAAKDPGWFCQLKTLYDTRAYDPEKTIAEERAEGMEESLIRSEYLCDWTAANVGSVWGDLMEALEKAGRTAAYEHPNDGVFTSWDLGLTDSTAIWFWRLAPGGIDFIDFYEAHGQPLSHYFDVLESKPYDYRKHWLPHDARQHTLASGTSIFEQFVAKVGAGKVAIGPSLTLLDGIQAGRWLLQHKTRFHARCGEGLEALKAYRYEYDDEKKCFTKKPVHDWASHPADAFRGAAVVARVTEDLERVEPPPKPVAVRSPDSFTLEECWDMVPSRPGRLG